MATISTVTTNGASILYALGDKFDTIRISILRDIIKMWKKLTMLKMSKTYILHIQGC